jgi:hypothetical protein
MQTSQSSGFSLFLASLLLAVPLALGACSDSPEPSDGSRPATTQHTTQGDPGSPPGSAPAEPGGDPSSVAGSQGSGGSATERGACRSTICDKPLVR